MYNADPAITQIHMCLITFAAGTGVFVTECVMVISYKATGSTNWITSGTGFSITGGTLVMDASLLTYPAFLQQKSSAMATASELEAGASYMLKITFSVDLTAGKSFLVFLG